MVIQARDYAHPQVGQVGSKLQDFPHLLSVFTFQPYEKHIVEKEKGGFFLMDMHRQEL